MTGSVLPSVGRRSLADSFIHRFRLDGDAADLVRSVFAPPEDVRSAVSLLGLVLLVVAALSFTRGLQRVYERAWRLPALGVRGTPAGLTWLLGVVLFLTLFAGVRAFLVDLAGPLLGVAIALLSWLVATGFVLVCCAAVGAVLAERLGQAGGQRPVGGSGDSDGAEAVS